MTLILDTMQCGEKKMSGIPPPTLRSELIPELYLSIVERYGVINSDSYL
jgi:hypothetical protein